MIDSPFIKDLLDLLLEDIEEETVLREQMKFLHEGEHEHTGSGLFIGFTPGDEALKHRSKEDYVLHGVKIKLPGLVHEADASLFIYEGLIDYIELTAHGQDYPGSEPTVYTLTQQFGNPPRTIERK